RSGTSARAPRSPCTGRTSHRKRQAFLHQLDPALVRQPDRIARRPPNMKIIEIEEAVPRLYQDQVELEATSDGIPWFFHEESARANAGFEAKYCGFSHLAYHVREPVASATGASLIPMLFMFCD